MPHLFVNLSLREKCPDLPANESVHVPGSPHKISHDRPQVRRCLLWDQRSGLHLLWVQIASSSFGNFGGWVACSSHQFWVGAKIASHQFWVCAKIVFRVVVTTVLSDAKAKLHGNDSQARNFSGAGVALRTCSFKHVSRLPSLRSFRSA